MNSSQRSTPDQDKAAFFHTLIDHSPVGMVVLDVHGVVQLTNRVGRYALSSIFPDITEGSFTIKRLDGQSILISLEEIKPGQIYCHTAEIDWDGEKFTLVIFDETPAEVDEIKLDPRDVAHHEREAQFQKFFKRAINGFVLARVIRDQPGEPVDFEFAQVNRAFENELQLHRKEILGKSARLFLPKIEEMDVWQALKDVAQSGRAAEIITYSDIYEKHFKLSIYEPFDGYVAVIFNDVTQQVEAENELRLNEAKYRSLFEAMALGVVIQNRAGEITAANPAAERILGLVQNDLIGKGSLNYDWQSVKLNGEVLHGENHPAMVALRSGMRVDDFILGLYNPKKNEHKWLSVSAVPEFKKGDEEAYQVITTFVDITDRIRVQYAFEERVNELRCLTEISSLLQQNPTLTEICQRTVQELVLAMKYSESAVAEIQLAGEECSTHPDSPPGINALVVPIHSSRENIGQIRVFYVEDLPFTLPEEKNLLESVADSLALWYDRTEIQQHLEESEARFRQAVMSTPTPIMIHADDGEVITLNHSWVDISGYSHADIPTVDAWSKKAFGDDVEKFFLTTIAAQATEPPYDELERTIRTKNGEDRIWQFSTAPLGMLPDGRQIAITIARDLTSRVQTEIEKSRYYNRILALSEIDQMVGSTLDIDEVLKLITSLMRNLIRFDSMSVMLVKGDSLEVVAGEGFDVLDQVIGLTFPSKKGYPNYEVIENKAPVACKNISEAFPLFTQPSSPESSKKIQAWLGIPLISQEGVIGMFTIDRIDRGEFTTDEIEIAMQFANRAAIAIRNAQLYEQTVQQIEKLGILRSIDTIITESRDLDRALMVILQFVTGGLGIDAASILLFDEKTQQLGFERGVGFNSEPDPTIKINLGQGFAGKVAITQKPLFIQQIEHQQNGQKYPYNLSDEGIASYYGLPLVAKGKLEGVLQLFHRSPFPLDPEWVEFVEILTGQAAIAVNNISLFSNLKTVNEELLSAYDATIEGWARALELRDKETIGHSQRVVELSVKIAREFGFQKEDLAHIRRGVLLHDIGKMGIPDEILQKPASLSEAEWEIMRQHPVFAYEMLKDIDYLAPALEIPHYHHERWDGSGYPEGLEGEAIPLKARIFSVVDVWDALMSDRYYRDAWSPDKVYQYLRENAGILFDPDIVSAFFKVVQAEQ